MITEHVETTQPLIEFTSILLGVSFGLDQTSQLFFILTLFLWLLSFIFSPLLLKRDHKQSPLIFYIFMFLTMVGNLGLIVSLDIISFYLFFTLMNFSAFGLITYLKSDESRWAGKVYISMVILGELIILPALWLIFNQTETLLIEEIQNLIINSSYLPLITVLILLGFGIKAGMVPLHIWLPLAHPIAPTTASAILSAAIIKAGVYGWIKLIPIGHVQYIEISYFFILLGLIGSVYGALLALSQTKLKSILAYSSVSQMGLSLCLVGMALYLPQLNEKVLFVIMGFIIHHALIKWTLFISTGLIFKVKEKIRYVLLVLSGFSALSLAGLPLTTGHLSKTYIKELIKGLPDGVNTFIYYFAVLTSFTTALAMIHFIIKVYDEIKKSPASEKNSLPFLVLWIAMSLTPITMITLPYFDITDVLKSKELFNATWPILLALIIYMITFQRLTFSLKEGDLLYLFIFIYKKITSPLIIFLKLLTNHKEKWVHSFQTNYNSTFDKVIGYSKTKEQDEERFFSKSQNMGIILLIIISAFSLFIKISA